MRLVRMFKHVFCCYGDVTTFNDNVVYENVAYDNVAY